MPGLYFAYRLTHGVRPVASASRVITPAHCCHVQIGLRQVTKESNCKILLGFYKFFFPYLKCKFGGSDLPCLTLLKHSALFFVETAFLPSPHISVVCAVFPERDRV